MNDGGDCSRVGEGIEELDGILVLIGTGISDAFGNCGDDTRLVGLLAFGVLGFMDGVLGDEGETGGLREDVELVGDDLVPTVFRGSGVGILEAARGDVTGVVFAISFARPFVAEVVFSS